MITMNGEELARKEKQLSGRCVIIPCQNPSYKVFCWFFYPANTVFWMFDPNMHQDILSGKIKKLNCNAGLKPKTVTTFNVFESPEFLFRSQKKAFRKWLIWSSSTLPFRPQTRYIETRNLKLAVDLKNCSLGIFSWKNSTSCSSSLTTSLWTWESTYKITTWSLGRRQPAGDTCCFSRKHAMWVKFSKKAHSRIESLIMAQFVNRRSSCCARQKFGARFWLMVCCLCGPSNNFLSFCGLEENQSWQLKTFLKAK